MKTNLKTFMNHILDMQKLLKNKKIFLDIDGTLSEYRFNDHVSAKDGTGNGQTEEEINSGIFLKSRPLKTMQYLLIDKKPEDLFIMGHYAFDKEIEDKYIWLKEHYPMISSGNYLFEYMSGSKISRIVQTCKERNISLEDVIFIDDKLDICRDAEEAGIVSYHISSFIF